MSSQGLDMAGHLIKHQAKESILSKIEENGWKQTDGSDETLQYGRKISPTSWEYKEWIDEKRDADYKLIHWDSDGWRSATIDLEDYTMIEILNAVETYGYSYTYYNTQGNFNLFQNGEEFGVEDSVQLACECIFELEL